MERHGDFVDLVFEHACEGLYGAPEYGGNRDLSGWRSIDFAGDVQPRGWTDEEVTNP
jgi:gluconate 2-dehydrogenase gamma chain